MKTQHSFPFRCRFYAPRLMILLVACQAGVTGGCDSDVRVGRVQSSPLATNKPHETSGPIQASDARTDVESGGGSPTTLDKTEGCVRFATFNLALNRPRLGALVQELKDGESEPAKKLAAVIQAVRPDVILLNELDFDEQKEALTSFCDQYLAIGQHGMPAIKYEHRFTDAVNTGVPSKLDLDGDDKTDGPADSFGFGSFPGQYGMAVLSRFPIRRDEIRTFRNFLWKDMPSAMLPQRDGEPYYSETQLDVFRLSSKSHWDVPIETPLGVVHFLCSHPTPPVFDGPEDRNGCRNHDEIRLFADYVSDDPQRSSYLSDDAGQGGGLGDDQAFVIAGDLNADPHDGDSAANAIMQLLALPRIVAQPAPEGAGGLASAQSGVNARHQGPPANDTSDFSDESTGNLRIDYVLPSTHLRIAKSGVYWPAPGEPGSELAEASDHRLVWIDVSAAADERDSSVP